VYCSYDISRQCRNWNEYNCYITAAHFLQESVRNSLPSWAIFHLEMRQMIRCKESGKKEGKQELKWRRREIQGDPKGFNMIYRGRWKQEQSAWESGCDSGKKQRSNTVFLFFCLYSLCSFLVILLPSKKPNRKSVRFTLARWLFGFVSSQNLSRLQIFTHLQLDHFRGTVD